MSRQKAWDGRTVAELAVLLAATKELRPVVRSLSRRERQTLERLLEGDSEKQVARRLGISRHTVHVYVKSLYRRLGVSTRAELCRRCSIVLV